MFEYKGKQYSLQDLQISAQEQGYENNFDEFIKVYTDDGMVEVSAPDDIPVFGTDVFSQQRQHARAEKAAREVLKNVYSNIAGVPKFALPYLTNFTGGAAGLASGLFKVVEATAENIAGMSAQEQREDGVNPISAALDSFHDFTDAFDTKYYDKNGRPLQVDELLEKGEYKKALQIASEQAAESAPSMIASAYNPILGGALMGVSTAGTTYYDDLENRPDATINEVVKNSAIAGSSEFLTEWAGGYAFRRINKIGQVLKGTGNAEKVAKDFTKGYINKFITRTLGSGIGEAATESVNSMVQDLGSNWVYDEAFDKKQFVSNVINSAVPALLLGGFGGGMSTLNKQDRKDLYKFVADGKWKRDYMDIGGQIYEKSNDYKAADDKQKVRIKEELDALQAKKQKHEQDLFDSFENLTDKELTDIAKNIDKINENAGIVGNKDFSETTQKQREQETIDLLQKNYNILGREYTGEDIEVDKIISESLKASERLDPMLKKLKGINKEDLETQVINTDKELQALPENIRKQVEKGDGYFLAKDKDGKAKIYINSKIAGLSGATNVVGHELLHYMISRKFKTNNKSMKPFVDNLKNYLQENHADVYSRLQTRIDNFYTNPDGTIKDGALEEYLTIFSDLVATQKIDLKENESKGFRDNVKDIVLGFGVGEVKLDTAQDFIKFIRAYNKNINRKGLLGKLMGTKILDVKLKSKTLKEGKPETIGKKSITAEEKTRVEQEVKDIGSTYNVEGGKQAWGAGGSDIAIQEIKEGKYFDDLIAATYKADIVPKDFVDKVYSELTSHIKRFNPQENDNLFAYINSQVRNKAGNVYNREYKQQEELKGAKDIDARTKEGAPVVQVADETATEKIEEVDVTEVATEKARELKNFDIELEDGLVDAEIEAEVEALVEQNPKDLKERLDKLVKKDFRKKLDNAVGKIRKVKGKVIIDPEYEAFIRKEYNEIVNSFSIVQIRTTYKNLFDREKVGVEDVKKIDPETGKVTYFRKDKFINKVNKPKFIKYFTQGGFTTIRERRSSLLTRIAERKTDITIDNYIERNSKDIDKVIEAKLRNLSRTEDNALNELKTFDTVKYSISMEFDKILNKGNKGKKLTKKGKVYYGYINPEDGKPQTFNDLGKIWEQAFSNYFTNLGIPGLKVKSTRVGEAGGMADFVFEILGETENHEIKAGLEGVRMGSTLINMLNLTTGKFALANKIHDNIEGLKDLVEKQVVPQLKKIVSFVNKEIEIYNKENNTNFKKLTGNITKGKPEKFPDVIYQKIKTQFGSKELGKTIVTDTPSTPGPVRNHYLSKLVKSISILNTKMFGNASFRLDDTSLLNMGKKPAPALEADVEAYVSIRTSGSSEVNGVKVRSLQIGIQFKIDKLLNNKSEIIDATTEQGFADATINVGITKPNITSVKNLQKAKQLAGKSSVSARGMSTFDFDETLIDKGENFIIAKDPITGEEIKISSANWPLEGPRYAEQGYEFDFTDFVNVRGGVDGPLLQKMKNQIKKFGSENVFVLTARPASSATAIHEWLKTKGINIPFKNITGLGNSTGEAKALWMLDKFAEGYNDMYFVDDALPNVTAVKNALDQLDIKSNVQQAKNKFSQSIDSEFNKILKEITGIETKKRFSDIKARKRGASKGKFRFFIPPSHEDFVGLLYNFMGKGKKGDQHRDFFEKALVRPLNRAYREIDTAKQAIANDYKALNKQFDSIKKKLRKKTPDGDFTFEDAVRIYLWNKHGHEIPGLSPTDQKNLVELVNNDSDLKSYAENINTISKQDAYVDPGNGWEAGNIKTDLMDATGRVGRAEFFAEFNENADVLFSKENLNKIEAAYGKDFRSALEDMLHRIKTGVNRPKGQSGTINSLMNYLNGSVGTVMFFNVRSAILQQMSIVNYINFADNNLFAAAKAFANQKQYWKDFAFIFNSDMLKQRRGGIGTDINGADLAQAVEGSKQPTKIVISKLLKLGFLPTQIGDNIAIATGGATFYRNRINKYIKDGLSQKEAEAKAFTDFQDLTQSTQQSSRPDMTSQQQASWIGKLVLNFQNITSQYNRIIKKAALDIKNRRISPPYTTQAKSDLGNLSKILYYGGIQNIIFYSLQTALFAVMFDDDQDEDQILKKSERVINGSIDSILRGAGIYGAVASTLKNMIIKFKEQREKGYNKDESAVPMELLNFSPVVGIKIRQLVNAEKTLNYNENIISEMETFEAENPMWSAVTNYTQALTNFPANRLYQKSINMRNALDKDYTNFQRVLFFSGYTTWSLGLGDSEAIIEAKEKAKINKVNTKKSKKSKSGRKKIQRRRIR